MIGNPKPTKNPKKSNAIPPEIVKEVFNPQPKVKSWYNKKYREFITSQPSIISGTGDTVPHHVRIDNNAGTAMKPSDFYCFPLPDSVHKAFHAGKISDREFFKEHGVDLYRELFELTSKWIRRLNVK